MKRNHARRLGRWAAVGVFSAVLALAASTPASAASPRTTSRAPVYNSPTAPQTLQGTLWANVSVTMTCWKDGAWANGTNRWFFVYGKGFHPYPSDNPTVFGYVSAAKIVNQANVPHCDARR
ncbi:hypothetical protein [Streptomyces sp. NPDC007369]|uniref:hypothetical protein n=1 Tax=Streptomyces sp. NPDC007369 TaxID=3154589 RepID=UPI0033EBD914